jgi:hypothetical protein
LNGIKYRANLQFLNTNEASAGTVALGKYLIDEFPAKIVAFPLLLLLAFHQ